MTTGFGRWIARSALTLLCAGLLMAAHCNVNAQYVEADEETFKFVQPDWAKYFENDSTLTPEQKERRKAVIDSWKKRIDAAKKSQ